MIDSGKVKNQAELARTKGISRARVTQILNLLKLDKNIIDNLEKIGNPKSEKPFYVKGLVVGSIQSGKTGNFNAVINRAIDCGLNHVCHLFNTFMRVSEIQSEFP